MVDAKKTIFCSGGGCTAKLGPKVLDKILTKLPKFEDKNLLVGFNSHDDASVYKLTDDLAMIQTLDFFPPMVDDPYTFGQIAATNAVSDVYAMGGKVKTAQNIVCFPESEDLNILGEIMAGGADKIREAGGVLSGGHSINDTSIKYGLAVTGIVNTKRFYPNNAVCDGDDLILTKPLGVGIVMAANSVQEASRKAVDKAITSMTTLNKYAAELMQKYDVHACTDVTGFSFAGHLYEMLDHKFSANIKFKQLPIIEEALAYADKFLITSAGQRNRNFLGDNIRFAPNIDFAKQEIIFDAQTSGGLLISINAKDSKALLADLQTLNLPCGIVGKINNLKQTQDKSIIIVE